MSEADVLPPEAGACLYVSGLDESEKALVDFIINLPDIRPPQGTTEDPGQKALLQKSEQTLSGWIAYTDLQIELSKDPENKSLWKRQQDYLNDLRLLEKRHPLPSDGDIAVKDTAAESEE